MRCGISANRLIMDSLSKAFSICTLTLKTPISEKRVLPIVERNKFLILFIALKDRSACAEVTGIMTAMCKTLYITLRPIVATHPSRVRKRGYLTRLGIRKAEPLGRN